MKPTWLRFQPAAIPSADELASICATFAAGDLIILPTDTVYGVAADERVEGAETAIYVAKSRPAKLLIPRLAFSIEQIEQHGAEISDAARKLAKHFWPGALTMVLSHPVFGSVAYRIPEHPVALAVLEAVQFPLLVTSANRSGEPETTTAEDAFAALEPSVSMVLDAGPALSKVPSSIVRLTGEDPEVLREGLITSKELFTVLTA